MGAKKEAIDNFLSFPKTFLVKQELRQRVRTKKLQSDLAAAAVNEPCSFTSPKEKGTEHTLDKPTRRIISLVKEGLLSKAARAMFDRPIISHAEGQHFIRDVFPEGLLPQAPPRHAAAIIVSSPCVLKALQRLCKGCAGGPSGWTEELLLQSVETSVSNLDALTAMCQDIAEGRMITDINISSLVLLPKHNDAYELIGVRPICISECLVKLVSAILCESASAEFAARFGNQYALRQGGAEVIFHSIAKAVHEDGSLNTVTIDCKNAFNAVDRRAMASALYHNENLSMLWPAFNMFYGTPTSILLDDGTRFLATRGGRQGDPLMMALFCLSIQDTLNIISTTTKCRVFAFADDITLVGNRDEVVEGFKIAERMLRNISLELNMKKCSVYGPECEEIAQHLSIAATPTGLKLLGGFLTTSEKPLISFLIGKIAGHSEFFEKLPSLPTQIALELLTKVGAPRWHHIARLSNPSPGVVDCHRAFDGMILSALLKILGVDKLSAQQVTLCSLPRKEGGFGICNFETTCLATFKASSSLISEKAEHFTEAQLIHKILADKKIMVATDPAIDLLRKATSRQAASAWISPSPLSPLMENAAFQAVVKYRLGCFHKIERVCQCGYHGDDTIHHVLGCTRMAHNAVARRHTTVLGAISNIFRNLGVHAVTEPIVEGKKRADLELFLGGKPVLVDLTIVNLLSRSHVRTDPEKTIAAKTRKKCQHYNLPDLVVLALEVTGGIPPQSLEFLKYAAKQCNVLVETFVVPISCAVQAANAEIILRHPLTTSFISTQELSNISAFSKSVGCYEVRAEEEETWHEEGEAVVGE